MKKHAYLIMAHNEFHMLKKLLAELDDERNDIYLHIDRKTKYVDEKEIASWVKNSGLHFVKRMNIHWGTLSIVKCELMLLKTAIKGNYSYYHLISGVDFPLKSQNYMHDFLDKETDSFIKYHADGEEDDYFLHKIKYYFPILRIVGKGLIEGHGKKQQLMEKLLKFQYDVEAYQECHGIDRLKKYKGMTFYKGDQWFSITHDLALYMLKNKAKILRMYWMTNGPDEIALQTLALNSQYSGSIRNNSLREIDWDRGMPYEYTHDDFDELTNSESFFARKISYDRDPKLVNELIDYIHGTNNVDSGEPLISVIVPCYNVESYLGECVESLLAQTYNNLEIILVDDGATDSTGVIARDYAEKYANVNYVHRENGGLSAARNTGIKNAKGEYLAFVDSDDYVDPDYIRKLYDAIKESGAEISVCGYKKEEMETDSVTFDKNDVISPHAAMRIYGDIYPKENVLLVLAWNKLYKKELFRNTEFAEGRIHEDEYTSHRILGGADSIALITDCLYHYRIREGSITAGSKAQNLKHLDLLDALRDRLDYTKGMMYGDLLIYMLYTYFEGMKQLMVTYTDDTIKENNLYSLFSRKAREVYFTNFKELNGFQKKDYLKLILDPKEYRDTVIRLRKEQAKQAN